MEPGNLRGKFHFHDLLQVRIGFDPGVITEVGQNVNAILRDCQIAWTEGGMVCVGYALVAKQVDCKTTILVAQGFRSAIIPPQFNGCPDWASVQGLHTLSELAPNQSSPNQSRTVGAQEFFASPNISGIAITSE